MSLINYFFGYPGELSVQAYPAIENLKMASGVATASGYYLPRAYTLNTVTVTWSAATIADTVTIEIINGASVIDTIELETDDASLLYATSSPAAQFGVGSYINAIVYGTGTNTITDLHVSCELATAGPAEEVDDILPNIAIATADLQTIKPNITQYLKDGEVNFDVMVLNCKRELYGEIKMVEYDRRPDYTNDEMDTLLAKIRDYPKEAYLANRLKYAVVGWILMDNRLYDEADYFIQHAKSIPLRYYIDDDGDSAADDAEQSRADAPRFGR